MRKNYLAFFIFILCMSCSKIADDGSSTDPNLIRISNKVCFDNNIKRYVYTGNLSKTKGDLICYNDELASLDSENKLLDSLSDDAHSKGLKLFIIYSKQNLEGRLLSKTSVDDSLGSNDGTSLNDTSVVTGTLSGTLKKNDVNEIDLSLDGGYTIDFEGYCSVKYVLTLHNLLLYITYHNLYLTTDRGAAFLLTSENAPGFPSEINHVKQFITLDGMNRFTGPLDHIVLLYTNTEYQNDAVWSCDYMVCYTNETTV